jgi:hypothetical protein
MEPPGTGDGRGVCVAAVWALARARLRGRWRALLGLTLLVGVAAGAVMTAAVGARRTETAGIVALTTALTFTASLDHLVRTPRLYGWRFDAVAGDWDLADPSSRRPPELTANPHVGAFAAVHFHQVRVEGAPTYTAAIDTADGGLFPTMVEGREPRGPDEIALGTRTLRQLGLRLGQTVELRDRRTVTMRIVGRSAGLAGETNTAAASGGVLTLDGLQRLGPDRGSGYGVFYVRYVPTPPPPCAASSGRGPELS